MFKFYELKNFEGEKIFFEITFKYNSKTDFQILKCFF